MPFSVPLAPFVPGTVAGELLVELVPAPGITPVELLELDPVPLPLIPFPEEVDPETEPEADPDVDPVPLPLIPIPLPLTSVAEDADPVPEFEDEPVLLSLAELPVSLLEVPLIELVPLPEPVALPLPGDLVADVLLVDVFPDLLEVLPLGLVVTLPASLLSAIVPLPLPALPVVPLTPLLPEVLLRPLVLAPELVLLIEVPVAVLFL